MRMFLLMVGVVLFGSVEAAAAEPERCPAGVRDGAWVAAIVADGRGQAVVVCERATGKQRVLQRRGARGKLLQLRAGYGRVAWVVGGPYDHVWMGRASGGRPRLLGRGYSPLIANGGYLVWLRGLTLHRFRPGYGSENLRLLREVEHIRLSKDGNVVLATLSSGEEEAIDVGPSHIVNGCLLPEGYAPATYSAYTNAVAYAASSKYNPAVLGCLRGPAPHDAVPLPSSSEGDDSGGYYSFVLALSGPWAIALARSSSRFEWTDYLTLIDLRDPNRKGPTASLDGYAYGLTYPPGTVSPDALAERDRRRPYAVVPEDGAPAFLLAQPGDPAHERLVGLREKRLVELASVAAGTQLTLEDHTAVLTQPDHSVLRIPLPTP